MLFHQEQELLGRAANQRLFQEATAGGERFEQSKTSPGRVQPEWRLSKVVYDPGLKGMAAGLERAIRARVPGVLRHLGIAPFDVGALELQLTSHNDGEFFKPHVDAGTPNTAGRMLTFVYYFHREPKAFAGGELVIVGPDGTEVTIEPENDSIVFFNSRLKHEVRRISCPSQRFEDGRFTLNGWVRRRERVATRSTFFDQRIFGPVNGWAPRPAHAAQPRARAHADVHAAAMAELQSRLYRQRRSPDRIDERAAITGDEFFEEFYCRNRPVVLRGLVAETEAVRSWTPEWFGRQFADVPVQITSGREDTPDYETRFRDSVQTVTMGEFVSRLGSESTSNDFYLVARNYFFDNRAFRGLRGDLTPPAEIINPADLGRGTAKLWFGPAGTVTPLHFDEHSILFTQVHGRKRFKLIPPFESPRLSVRNSYYSAIDPEASDVTSRFPLFAGVPVADVVVEPGDALFLPAGWWHWARALDVSISATFCSFSVDGRNARIGDRTAAVS